MVHGQAAPHCCEGGRVTGLPCGQDECRRSAGAVGGEVDLRGQSPRNDRWRGGQARLPGPLFFAAPAACWRAHTIVESPRQPIPGLHPRRPVRPARRTLAPRYGRWPTPTAGCGCPSQCRTYPVVHPLGSGLEREGDRIDHLPVVPPAATSLRRPVGSNRAIRAHCTSANSTTGPTSNWSKRYIRVASLETDYYCPVTRGR